MVSAHERLLALVFENRIHKPFFSLLLFMKRGHHQQKFKRNAERLKLSVLRRFFHATNVGRGVEIKLSGICLAEKVNKEKEGKGNILRYSTGCRVTTSFIDNEITRTSNPSLFKKKKTPHSKA